MTRGRPSQTAPCLGPEEWTRQDTLSARDKVSRQSSSDQMSCRTWGGQGGTQDAVTLGLLSGPSVVFLPDGVTPAAQAPFVPALGGDTIQNMAWADTRVSSGQL